MCPRSSGDVDEPLATLVAARGRFEFVCIDLVGSAVAARGGEFDVHDVGWQQLHGVLQALRPHGYLPAATEHVDAEVAFARMGSIRRHETNPIDFRPLRRALGDGDYAVANGPIATSIVAEGFWYSDGETGVLAVYRKTWRGRHVG